MNIMVGPYELGKEITVKTGNLTYKHIFSMKYLYKRMHEWLVDEGYGPEKWKEKLYLERHNATGMKEIWVFWRTNKAYQEHQGSNSFFKFVMNVDFHALNLANHEVVIDGSKVKTHKGEITISVTSKLVIDPDNTWANSFIMKNEYLQNWFINRIYKSRIEAVENELVSDTARFLGAVKQYFQLESWHPEYADKPFHPAKGTEFQ